jgi:hypothetical protein
MKSATITVDNDDLILIAEKLFISLKEMGLEHYPDLDLKEVFLDSKEKFFGHIFEVGLVTYQKGHPLNEVILNKIYTEIQKEKKRGQKMSKLRRLNEMAEKWDVTEDQIVAFAETNPQVTFFYADEETLMNFLVDVAVKLEKYMGSPIELKNLKKPTEFLNELEKRRSEKKKEATEND